MKLAAQVQILDEAVHILLHANDLGKGINPSVLSPAMGADYDKKVPEFEKKYLKKAGGHIGRNVVIPTSRMDIVDLDKVLDDFEEDEEKASALVPGRDTKPGGYSHYLPPCENNPWEAYTQELTSTSNPHQLGTDAASHTKTITYEAAHKFDISEANFSLSHKEDGKLDSSSSIQLSAHNEHQINFQNCLNAKLAPSAPLPPPATVEASVSDTIEDCEQIMRDRPDVEVPEGKPCQETQPPGLLTPITESILKTESLIIHHMNTDAFAPNHKFFSCGDSSQDALASRNETRADSPVECVGIYEKPDDHDVTMVSETAYDSAAGKAGEALVCNVAWSMSNSQEEPMHESSETVIKTVEDVSAVCLNNNMLEPSLKEKQKFDGLHNSLHNKDQNGSIEKSQLLNSSNPQTIGHTSGYQTATEEPEVVGFDCMDDDENVDDYLDKCCSAAMADAVPSAPPTASSIQAECIVHSVSSDSPMELPEVVNNGDTVIQPTSVASEYATKAMDLSNGHDSALVTGNSKWPQMNCERDCTREVEKLRHDNVCISDNMTQGAIGENGFPSLSDRDTKITAEPAASMRLSKPTGTIENGFPGPPLENGVSTPSPESQQSSILGARPKEPPLPKMARPNSLLGLSKVCLDTPFAAATIAPVSISPTNSDKSSDNVPNGFLDSSASTENAVPGLDMKQKMQQSLSPLQKKLINMEIKQRLETETEAGANKELLQHNCDAHLLPCDVRNSDGTAEKVEESDDEVEVKDAMEQGMQQGDDEELVLRNRPDLPSEAMQSLPATLALSQSSPSGTQSSSTSNSTVSGPARPHSWSPSSGTSSNAASSHKQKRPTSLNLPQRNRDVNSQNDWSGGSGSQSFPNDSEGGRWNQGVIPTISEENEAAGVETGQEVTYSPTSSQSSVGGGGGSADGEDECHQPQQPSQHQQAQQSETMSHSQLGMVAPIWVPDSDAPNCMQCEARFTFTKRRHHCRACGKVFCSACCSMKNKLQYMENKEARVCLACHQLLNIRDVALDNLVITKSCCKEEMKAESRSGRSPNPNNPSEYCSTIPPLQQANAHVPLPTVMVPVGVLKREGSQRKGEPKQVIFSDGIRPGGDLTEEVDGPQEARLPPRRTGRAQKKVERVSQGNEQSGSPRTRCLRSTDSPRNKCLIPENGLPPVLLSSGTKDYGFDENPDPEQILPKIKNDQHEPVIFAINSNLFVMVKIVQLDCCVNRTCWCFTTKGMCTVGQDEIVIVLECFHDEKTIPKDVFWHFHTVYEEAYKGNTVSDMGHTIFNQSFLGSRDHGGFLYIRPTFQCLQKIMLPSPPYLFGILLQTWEAPWAKVFPIRLLLRLGAEYRYYPCPLISVRNRKPVFYEIGHTIMNLLADFRNYQYMLPQIRGVTIHMEDKRTVINFPRNRYDDLMKVVTNSNEHVMALGANFSAEADSHLVCIQNDDANYQTQAINIQNKPRKGTYSVESHMEEGDACARAQLLGYDELSQLKLTGASFVVFNGALKTSSGLTAKSSIVEDGLMVQITPDSMAALKQAMKDMSTYTIGCGSISTSKPEEIVLVHWVDDDKSVNVGVRSPIDKMLLDGVESIHIHNSPDYIGESRAIRWTEVFLIQNEDSNSSRLEPVDLSRLAETLAQACCIALTPHLDRLKESAVMKLGLRVNIESERVGYEIGSNGIKLPDFYMNDLDNELIPVIHNAASRSQDGPIVLELIFHILD